MFYTSESDRGLFIYRAERVEIGSAPRAVGDFTVECQLAVHAGRYEPAGKPAFEGIFIARLLSGAMSAL
jgi:hypothetical protein